jgi:hypothetical protein
MKMSNGFPKTITTTKLDNGHYRIDREDGYNIEVRRRSKREWYQVEGVETRKTLASFEHDVKTGNIGDYQVEEAPKAPKVTKTAAPKAKGYKNHRSARTAELHRLYDELERKAALASAVNDLAYTASGAASWFSHWDKQVQAA